MAENFDLIVIGAGSASTRRRREGVARARSPRRAHRARPLGRQLSERRVPADEGVPRRGGARVHRQRAERVDGRSTVGRPRVDLARVRAWKDSLRRTQESWVDVLTERRVRARRRRGVVRRPRRTVRVGERELTADRILIATGSRTAVPPVPGIEEVEWIDHVSALELEQIPESLLVVGAGPVGLEFAQIFARFGSRVTIVNHGAADRRARRRRGGGRAAGGARGRGHRDRARTPASSRSRATATRRSRRSPGGREVRASHVLLASGRAPNTEELGARSASASRPIAATSSSTTASARASRESGRSATSPIGPQFTPAAQYQARIAIDDMFATSATGAPTTR